jgi:hypothetical protein
MFQINKEFLTENQDYFLLYSVYCIVVRTRHAAESGNVSTIVYNTGDPSPIPDTENSSFQRNRLINTLPLPNP